MSIRVFLSSRDTADRIAAKSGLEFVPDAGGEEKRLINVHPDIAFQEILGFGGAFTDSAAETLAKLSPDVADRVMTAYFDPDCGHAYSLCRTHINSCDFSLDNYSYVEDNDFSLKSFSIEHDRRHMFPMMRRALELGRAPIRIFASPWSPPGWMKTTGTMNHGGRLLDECRPIWAEYYARYIKAAAREGVPIWAVTIQNEAKAKQIWDSCVYTAEDERDFVGLFLGPTLEREGLSDVKIFVWDHNKERLYERANVILSDPAAARYTAGIAIHFYSGDHFDAISLVRHRFPHAIIFHSEGGFDIREGANVRGDVVKRGAWICGELYGHDIIGDLNAGAAGWVDWNLLLDETGGPNHVNNLCLAAVMADVHTGELSFHPPYWFMGHFSRFIKPGAVRVGSSCYSPDIEATAARNPDGELVLVAMNNTDVERPFTLRCDNQLAATILPPHSIATLCWKT